MGTKAKSKVEMYSFVFTVDVRIYLPPQFETSIYFIRDIIANTKRVTYFVEIIEFYGIMDRGC